MVLVPNFQENKNKYRQLDFYVKKLEKKIDCFLLANLDLIMPVPNVQENKNKYWQLVFYVKHSEEDCWFSSS